MALYGPLSDLLAEQYLQGSKKQIYAAPPYLSET